MMDSRQEEIAKEFDRYRETYETAVNDAKGFAPLKVDNFLRAKATDLLTRARLHFGYAFNNSIVDLDSGIGQYHPLLEGDFGLISRVDVLSQAIEHAWSLHPLVHYEAYDRGRLPFDADAVLVQTKQAKVLFEEAGFKNVTTTHVLTILANADPLKTLDRLLGMARIGTQDRQEGLV